MIKHIKWPSIEQFRNVCKAVTHRAQYVGKAEDGSLIMNRAAVKPTLKFEGTVKLHGTNAAVCLDADGDFWAQSRENIITPEQDNAGFATFAYANREAFDKIFRRVYAGADTTVIFGEWCGKGIQKGVAISELPKMFVIFGVAIVSDKGDRTYLAPNELMAICGSTLAPITCIYNFPTYNLVIDFENPHESQNRLNELTEVVESECPVGKAYGVSGIGEGIVWRCIEDGWESSDYWFKVKGDKHSKSKVRTLATVDVERINNIKELAEGLANNERLEQIHQQVFDTLNGGETDMKRMGEFIKALMADVFKEEQDTIDASGFTSKEISQPIFAICRKFISEKL